MSTADVFGALADPVRRRLLKILANGLQTAGALSAQFALSRPAVPNVTGVGTRATSPAD
jgi:DNA-binding transcriptional ArsR family regulator